MSKYIYRNFYCFNNAIRHFLKMDSIKYPTDIDFGNSTTYQNEISWSEPFEIHIRKSFDSDDKYRRIRMPNILNFNYALSMYESMYCILEYVQFS